MLHLIDMFVICDDMMSNYLSIEMIMLLIFGNFTLFFLHKNYMLLPQSKKKNVLNFLYTLYLD